MSANVRLPKQLRLRKLTDAECRRLFAEAQEQRTAEQLADRCRRQGQRQQPAAELPELREDRG